MRKKTLLTFAVAGALCASAGGVISGVNTLTASGEEKTALLVTELFAPSAVLLEPISQDPNSQRLDKGLLLKSSDKKSTIEWQDTVSGAFSFNYLPVQTGAMYDAKSLEITFTDVEDQDSFTLVIEHGATMNAYVRFNGISAGVYYNNKAQAKFTSFANLKGLYTQFSATSVGVTFDPSTMCVYAGTTEDTLLKVWDLSEAINDERDVNTTLDPFAKYRVSFKMPSFSLQSGSVILYEANGCKLNELMLQQSGEPSVFADFETNAVVNEKYTLPKGYGYDVIDEALDAATAVYAPNGMLIGENLTDFTPTQAGEYTVAYTATNSYGESVTEEYALIVYQTAPEDQAELDWTLNDEYVLNEQVYIPELWLSGGLRRYGKELGKLTIEKDGETYTGFDNKTSGFAFTFTEAGSYEFIYDINGEEVRYNVLVDDAENRFVTAGLQATYKKNTLIDCRDFYVVIGGENVVFDFVVKFPSGKRYANQKFQANETGRYALNASTTVNGKKYVFEKTFTVFEDNTDYFVALHGAKVENGKSDYTGREGLRVTTTTAGALVEYTEPINISKYVNQRVISYDDQGAITGVHLAENAIPLIEMSVDPATVGTRAAQEFFIYITDASDPTNKITINARNRSRKYAAVSAGAPEQTMRGFTNLKTGAEDATAVIDGQTGNIAVMGSTCFRIEHTFDGLNNAGTNAPIFALYYDNEAKQLLGKPTTGSAPDNHVIMDFDDTRYLQSDLPWEGFKSDYVYISVAIGELLGPKATSCIYSIGGRSLGNVEVGNPTIDVEAEDTLVGLKGQSLAVPNATATDCYSAPAKIVSKVYYEKNGNRYDVSVQNGRFNTAQSGDYYIVYTAIDVYGRTSEKQIKVNVAETHEELKATLEDPTAEYVSGKIRDEIPVLGIESVALTGAIGEVESACKVYLGTEEIAYKGGIFIPEKAGEYKVEYTFTDAVGRTVKTSYNVVIAVPEKPVITSALPAYVGFVRGNSYEIADVYFIDYAKTEPTEQKAEVYIGGEKISSTKYTVENKVEGVDEEQKKETVVLEYKYGDIVIQSYEIPVITVKKIAQEHITEDITIDYEKTLLDRYFMPDENTTFTTNKAYFTMSAAKGNAKVAFVEPLQANGFNIAIDLDQERKNDLSPIDTNIKTLKLHIVDASDIEKSLLVEVQTDPMTNKARLCINGEDYSPAFKGSLVGAAVELIRLRYNDGYFYDANSMTKLVTPLHYANGDAFEGFSNAIYVTIEIEAQDAEKGTAMRLLSINEQQLSNETISDELKPVLSIENEHGGLYEYGTEIELSAAKAYDVLSGINYDSLTVSVTYERNGETKYAKIGDLTLDKVSAKQAYQLVLTETGSYKVVYSVLDGAGNESTVTFVFEVVKYEDPVIMVQGELPERVKAGGVVQLPSVSATFVQENEANMTWIVVISPSTNTYTLITDADRAFKATELGDYKVRYCAIDAYGSYSIIEYVIECYA